MIDLSPKNQFQTLHKQHSDTFAELIANPSMRIALTSAFAQLQYGGVTTEEMLGAKKFMVIFAGMAENEVPEQMPAKSLKQIP